MAIILNLETATTNCSVSIARNGELLAIKEHDTPSYSHSEQLHIFIEEVLAGASLNFSDLDAIAVSKGPGSYTGLRIGVSAAKGLCFALDVPLISVPTLENMMLQVRNTDFDFIIPMLDARRMEVYSAVFDRLGNEIRETRAEIIEETSFIEFTGRGRTMLVGNGAAKCEGLLRGNISYDSGIVPSAGDMCLPSFQKFELGHFEDVAYFEPFYLKDFILQGKKP